MITLNLFGSVFHGNGRGAGQWRPDAVPTSQPAPSRSPLYPVRGTLQAVRTDWLTARKTDAPAEP